MVELYRRFHDFLLNQENELSKPATYIPEVREQIQQLPETAAYFQTGDVLDYSGPFNEIHYEFLKAWPYLDRYGPGGTSKRYVNPNYIHAHRFSDIVVTCRCGAEFVRNYEDEYEPIDSASRHKDHCLPHWRLRARAEVSKQRYQMIKRLGWLGWKGSDMGHRFGVTENHAGSYARDYHLTMRECYDQYRQAAANTCAHLLTRTDVEMSILEGVYGHTRSTLMRWMKEYTNYEPVNGGGFNHPPQSIPKPDTMGEPEIQWDPESLSFVES